MFVERMEVLEYRQKFEVELSTFPDSTNTKTPRKLVFSLTCVCLSVRLSVCLCAKKFVSGYLTRELTDLDENYGVCYNWRRIENLPYPVQSDHYFLLIWGGGWFLQFFEPLYIGNYKRYRKTEKTRSTWTLKIYNFDFVYLFDISNGFRDILKKLFLKKVCQGLGVAKTPWLGSKHV